MTALDEAGIKRADALRQSFGPKGSEVTTREIIEAYLTEPPKWPTDETMDVLWVMLNGRWTEYERSMVRRAMLADPIIKAAIALRDEWVGSIGAGRTTHSVIRAVNEAGL